jgi:hypothetical protein
MTDAIDFNHLASQNERILAEIARLREEMDGLRDEMEVLTRFSSIASRRRPMSRRCICRLCSAQRRRRTA